MQYFWEQVLDGMSDTVDTEDGQMDYVIITAEDIAVWPELSYSKGNFILMYEDSNGFVRADIVTPQAIDELEQEQMVTRSNMTGLTTRRWTRRTQEMFDLVTMEQRNLAHESRELYDRWHAYQELTRRYPQSSIREAINAIAADNVNVESIVSRVVHDALFTLRDSGDME